MKKGDIIYCVNIKDLRQTMKDPTAAGYHAVRDSDDNFSIRITGVPETQYLLGYTEAMADRQDDEKKKEKEEQPA